MTLAIRTITRLQDADDFGTALGAGVDGCALTWDNDAGEFVVDGNITLPLSASSEVGVIYKESDRWIHDYHQTDGDVPTIGMSVYIGKLAGNFTMGAGNTIEQEASRNTGIGYSVMTHNTLGHLNTGVGWEAVLGVTTGWGNSGFGACALCYNEGGCENTGIGVDAMMWKSGGDKNTAVGFRSLFGNLTGSRNIAIGHNAGYYELGSDALYIDAYNRTDTAGDKAGAIVYGTMSSTPESQRLRFNANVGVGVAAQDIYSLYVSKTSAVTWVGIGNDLSISAAGKIGYGAIFNVNSTHASGDMNVLYGFRAAALNTSSSSGNVSSIYGAYIVTGMPDYAGASGTYISSNYGLFVDVAIKAGNTIYNNYGIYIAEPSGGGDISVHNAIVTASGNVVLNESGNAYSDVRIEGDTDASLVVVDASENSVAIGSVATSKVGLLGATPSAQLAHVANASTEHAVTDPGDAPADADALRDDLVTNVIPSIESALNALGTKINSLLTMAETFGFHATS